MSELDEDEAEHVGDEENVDVQQTQLRDRLSIMNSEDKVTKRKGFFNMFVDDVQRVEENDKANDAIKDVEMIGNLNGKSQSLFTSFLGQRADAQDDGFEEEELFNMETLGPFAMKEFKAAFAVVSEGKSSIDIHQVVDVFVALGYTLVGSEKRHLLQCIHRDKHDRVTIDSLEHTYVQWRRCLSDHSKDFLYDYAKHVKVLYKMILMNKRIPSVYTVKYYNKNGSFEDYMNTNDTAGCALDENILRNILGQVSIDEQVFDHEDIDPNVCSRVMKEMITYDRRKIGVLEETTQVEEKDFLKFMQFR